ncbi:M20 family metallopeptidase [soil metagenome]
MLKSLLRDDAEALADDLADLRHRLHRHPEIGLDLPWTQGQLLAELDGLGLELSTGSALTSITAVLRGGSPGASRPSVLLRADMDALPVQEATALDFASELDGAMHACGHDLHMTMLVGAARLLAARRDELPGDVVFMFQPGEEGWDGAGRMIEEGVLDASGSRVRNAYGIHVFANKIPTGVFTSRPGTLMAASDWLALTVRGKGGHGSAPHTTRDPVSAIAEMVSAMHAFVTRRFDIFDPVVLTVGSLHAGTKRNIIPDDAQLDATIRTFSEESRELMRTGLPQLCRSIGEAFGVEVDAEFREEYPLTVNDPYETGFVADTVADLFGADGYLPMAFPEAGAEDFSRVLAEVPGCYVMLGASVEEDFTRSPSNHSSLATFSDAVLPKGAELLAQLAIRSLSRNGADDV